MWVFNNLQKALAVYAGGGKGAGSGEGEGKKPIENKEALVEALNIALNAAHSFALAQNVNTLEMLAAEPWPASS
jgi:type I restriction enzyme R subunit